ncbi:hypothetical protein [Psychromonas sp. B3M02]|uniref:hypothetical protein n=1 Tax=Psychromonas sp. B3M02 TaxID=2267226 RepID=UPI0011BE2981|nr:hypothetical protein [Psychromonas sp. B3M02]
MTEIISSKTMLTVGTKAFDVIKNAYQSRKQERVSSFFKCVETRYEYMDEEQRAKLNESINSIEGQEVLAQYADAITQTSSDRVRMAIALLYCNDCDFNFSEFDQRIFINGVTGITDHIIDFFIESIKRPKISGNYPYERHSIEQSSLPDFNVENVDAELVYSYINELIRRRLLLPDPAVGLLGDNKGWFITYGSSDKTNRMARLLEKAGEVMR